jgi:Tfp pilus assembly protein PilN
MLRLDLDFQKKPVRWPLTGLVVLVAGIGLTAALIGQHIELNDELLRSEGHVMRLKRDMERQRLLDARVDHGSADDSTGVTKKRSREQWDALFQGLESVADDTVTLLSLEPGAVEIAMRGEARDFAAMTAYVERLAKVSAITDVRLTEHEIARDHPRHPLRFLVQAQWKDAPR